MTPERKDRLMGEILVSEGFLTEMQVEEILAEQRHNRKPFGLLANMMCGVPEEEIWKAYAHQMAEYVEEIDLVCEVRDPRVADILTVREAWSHLMMPLRIDGDALIVATSRGRLADAMAYAHGRFNMYVHFVYADRIQLEQYIMEHYVKTRDKSVRGLEAAAQ